MTTVKILRASSTLVIVWASVDYKNVSLREQLKAKGYKWCPSEKTWFKVVTGVATDEQLVNACSAAFTQMEGKEIKCKVLPVWDYSISTSVDRGYDLRSPSVIACINDTKEQGFKVATIYANRLFKAIGIGARVSEEFLNEQYTKFDAIRKAAKASKA